MHLSSGDKFGLLGLFLAIVLIAGAVIGYVTNICKFAKCDFNAPYKAEIVRGVGIPFAPMGAVVGYFDIKDTPEINKKPR